MSNPDNVVELKPKAVAKDERQADKMWSAAVMKQGYSIVPVLMLHGQKRLGLSAPQLNVVLQLLSHWWTADDLPYPSKKTIANRMDCTPRQVQRYFTELEQAGLIRRKQRWKPGGGQNSNAYDLSGLVAKMVKLAPEFQAEADERKRRRADLEKRGGGRMRAKPGRTSSGQASS